MRSGAGAKVSALLYDPAFQVSVHLIKDEQGRTCISIKGPDRNATVKYNEFEMRPHIRDEAILSVTSVSKDGSVSIAWGQGLAGGHGGGACCGNGDPIVGGNGSSAAYGGCVPAQSFSVPQGVTHVVASEGTTTTIVKLDSED
jgi:hypothetical protein